MGAEELRALLGVSEAAAALQSVLADGFDPETDGARSRVAAAAGDLLLMPSVLPGWLGAKLVTVREQVSGEAPAVQGTYVLFEGRLLSPFAVLDGTELTRLRTPAVSLLAVRHLTPPGPVPTVVFGAGTQAAAHVEALAQAGAVTDLVIVARDADRTAALLGLADRRGLRARVGAPRDVADAGLVVCATSAVTPLFDARHVGDQTLVVAVGTHTARDREVPGALLARAQVVVESRDSALREAGDVVLAIAEEALNEDDLITMAEVVNGHRAVDLQRPRVFKSTGMPWQDLAVAVAAVRATGPHEVAPWPPPQESA